MNKKKIEVVCAVIKNEKNEVLIAERGYGEFKHMWEFPGGKLEPNETKDECILREIKEELNADITIEKFITTINYPYDNYDLIMHAFLCKLLDAKLELNEHLDVKWCDLRTIKNERILPADLLIVDFLIKNSI